METNLCICLPGNLGCCHSQKIVANVYQDSLWYLLSVIDLLNPMSDLLLRAAIAQDQSIRILPWKKVSQSPTFASLDFRRRKPNKDLSVRRLRYQNCHLSDK